VWPSLPRSDPLVLTVRGIGLWQGVAMDSLKFHLGLPYPTLLRLTGGLPRKWPYGRFRGGPPTGQVACGRLLPLWTPNVHVGRVAR
jgi:hypothetical protein